MAIPYFRVGDLAEQVRGVSYGKKDASSVPKPGYVPVLRANNITDNGLVFEDLVFVPTERVSEKQRIRRHDVVIAASSGSIDVVGKAASALTDFEGGFGAFCKVLRPNSKVDPSYFSHFFKTRHYRSRVSALAEGANINNLRNEHLDNLEIPLPPIAQQKRIAAILDKADELRSLRRRALEQLDAIAQSIFLEMFGESLEQPKNSQISSLGSHLLFLTSGGRGWAKFYSNKGNRFIRSLDVQMNYISNEEPVYVVPPDNAEARRTKVARGDVLLTITGSRIGRVAPVPNSLTDAFISQHVAILRPDPAFIDPVFLSFFLSMESGGQKQIAKAQYGQTKPGLNFEQINGFKIPIPPLSFQQGFTKRIDSVERLKSTHRKALSQLDALFASLQHRAFRGKL